MNLRQNPCCTPFPFTDCGVETKITCSECITRLCCSVVYTITVTNHCKTDLRCCTLHIDLPEALAYECGTLEVRRGGEVENLPDENLETINLGDIDEHETVIVIYRCTVMTNTRYIRTRAAVTCFTCCCCRPERHVFPSCGHLLQVCGCCCRD